MLLPLWQTLLLHYRKRGNNHTSQSRISRPDNCREADNNLLHFHGDAASSAVEDAAISYQSPSIIAAGANAQSVSVLATLVNLSLALICVKAPALIEKIGLAKKGAVTFAFINMLAWVPLIVAFLLSEAGITPVWFALLWLVNIMPGMMLSFQRDNWLSNLVPQNSLGRYLGQRLAIKSAFYLGAFCLLGYLMDSFGGKSLVSFAFVFILALVMALVDFIIFTHMKEPANKNVNAPNPAIEKIKFGLFDFIGELKEKKLDTFILFTSFFYLTVGLSGPLYAVYMLQEKNFTYLGFTVIITAEYLARVVSAPFWGRFADKAGNIRVLSIVSRIIPVIPICWLFCSNIGYLAFIQTISGVCWGAFDLSTQSYLYKVAPQAKKLRYIVYTRSLILLATAMGGLLGAYLVKGVFHTFGSQLLTVFMISGLFRAVVVMFLMPKLVDLAVKYGKAPDQPAFDFKVMKMAVVSKHGQFYRKAEPAEKPVLSPLAAVYSPVLSGEVKSIRKLNYEMRDRLAKAEAAKREIIELSKNTRRRNWATGPNTGKENKETVPPTNIIPSRRPWYGDPEILAAHKSKIPAATGAAFKMNPEKAGGREGLFYNDTGWAQYMRESLQTIIRESRERKPAVTMKPVLVENKPRISGTMPARGLRLVRVPVYH